MDFLKWIGENDRCEKKVCLERKKPKSWLKTVSAFANCEGGVIIWGIDDDDNQIGIEDAKSDSELISSWIKDKMDPAPLCNLNIHQYKGREYITLKVHAGLETPYYFVHDSSRTAYHPNGVIR